MSTVISALHVTINGYKTYCSVILATVTGIGLIFAKDHSQGTTDVLHALFVVLSGATVASLRHAVSKAMPES